MTSSRHREERSIEKTERDIKATYARIEREFELHSSFSGKP